MVSFALRTVRSCAVGKLLAIRQIVCDVPLAFRFSDTKLGYRRRRRDFSPCEAAAMKVVAADHGYGKTRVGELKRRESRSLILRCLS